MVKRTFARWLARDPLGVVDGPNVYVYVRNMPEVLIDPEGLTPIWVLTLLRACIAGAAFGVAYTIGEVLAVGLDKKDLCDGICAVLGGCVGGALTNGIFGIFVSKLLPTYFPRKVVQYVGKKKLPPMGAHEWIGGLLGAGFGGASCGFCTVTCRKLREKLGL